MKNKDYIKPTLLDFAILGLIQDQPLSGYAIRKLFKETALGNYSSSPGTIYPALNRLQKFELVKKNVQVKTGKTCFEITTNGILTLKNWFLKPVEKIEVEKKTDELLLRFGFMETLLDKNQRINFLTSFQNLLNTYIKELQAFYNKESNNMPLHGRLAFQFGIDSNKTTLKWCKKAISQLK
jgi:DNA-binding PadR family transcriptional regulator